MTAKKSGNTAGLKAAKGKKRPVKPGTSRSEAAERKRRFAVEYVRNGGNALRAAIEAGYSPKSAGQAGCGLRKDPKVVELIQAAADKAAAAAGLSLERTLKEVARLAYMDPRKLYDEAGALRPVTDLDDDTAATIASIEVEEIGADGAVIGRTKRIRHWDKNAALEKAMKFHGAYEADNRQKPPATVSVGELTVALDFDRVLVRAKGAAKGK